MSSEKLDLSHLAIREAERHVGHLLRQSLTRSRIGAFVLKGSDGSLSFLNAAVFLKKIPIDELVQFLISAGISEDVVIDLVAALEENTDDDTEAAP